MSGEEEERVAEINDDDSSNKGKKSAKYDSSAADLEKVTDYVEESEISSKDIGEVKLNASVCQIYFFSNLITAGWDHCPIGLKSLIRQ